MTDLERAANLCENGPFWMRGKDCAKAIRALSPAQPEEWVSVKDRLPGHEWVLVSFSQPDLDECGYENMAYQTLYDPERQHWSGNDPCDDCCTITHWMPLPAPPQAETAPHPAGVAVGNAEADRAQQLSATSDDHVSGAYPAPAAPMEPFIVAWLKHGPYDKGEPVCCVMQDPHDDDCYSPLVYKSGYDALRAALAYREEEIRGLREELSEARSHIGRIPSRERIKEAHSYLEHAIVDGAGNPYANGHGSYLQGRDEGCYICALSMIADRAGQERDAAQRELAESQRRLAGILEIAEDREDINNAGGPNDWMRVVLIAKGKDRP